MKKFIYNIIMLLSIGLSLVSCISTLIIEKSLPPEVEVKNEQWKVVVVNRFNPNLLPYKRERKIEVVAGGAEHAFEGVLDAIKKVTYSLVAVLDTSFRMREPGEHLTAAQIGSIYDKYPHHLLLSLDGFDAFFEQTTVREKDAKGKVDKTAHYTLTTQAFWILYDSTGNIIDRTSIHRDELYNSRNVISGLLAIGPSMGNAGPQVNRLAWHTGSSYWERLSPQSISFMRHYYVSKTLEPSAKEMAVGQWDQAIILLTPIAEGSIKKDAGRAAYNLAIVHEAKGNINEAKKWARISVDKGNKFARLLLSELR